MRHYGALALIGVLLYVLGWPATAYAQEPHLLVPSGETHSGDLASLGRAIVVLGNVDGDVTNWSGTITIEGSVSGDVVSYGGTIVLGPHAEVGGNLLALAGAIERADGAQVAGAALAPQLANGAVLAGIPGFLGDGRPASSVTQIGSLPLVLTSTLVLLLTGLAALLWPYRLQTSAAMLQHRPAHALGFGMLTAFLYAALILFIVTIFTLSLLGLPLVPLLLMVAQLPFLLGLTVVGFRVGSALGMARGGMLVAPTVTLGVVIIGALALGLSALLNPLFALLGLYAVASFGLGAIILSRGGFYGTTTQ
jgi:hypothetical protein